MVQLTKNLPQLIQVVVKTYNDLQLLLDYSKGSFLVSGKQKMTAYFLLSFMCFRKMMIFRKVIG